MGKQIRITFQQFTFTLMIADLIDRILRSEVLYYNQCTRSDLERWNTCCVTKLKSGKCYQAAAKTKTKKRIHNGTKNGACSFSHSIIKIECLIYLYSLLLNLYKLYALLKNQFGQLHKAVEEKKKSYTYKNQIDSTKQLT